MNPLDKITVTDDDIDWVEGLLKLKFDRSRREIIKNLDSFDVQAFPGTGKTTVILAKLAILASKWPSGTKGICVLSYTNVAKKEIEQRLGNSDVGQKLLHYPHFIGTLYSFFDTFAGVPRLHQDGYSITVIDDEITEEKRFNRLGKGARFALEKKGFRDRIKSSSYPEIEINLGMKKTTDTYKNVTDVIKKSFDEGYFFYNEVLLAAEKSVDEYSWLSEALQNRFPLVIIDEAQDTDQISRRLLDKAFPKEGKSRLEYFGDVNQAIYNSNIEQKSCWNPANPMTIPDSKRFGERISRLSKSLAVNSKEFRGVDTEFDNRNIQNKIFLFDESSIHNVIPTFAEYVLQSFTTEELERYKECGVHVVCRIGKNDDDETKVEHFPRRISDYWPQYSKQNSSVSRSDYLLLIDYFKNAQSVESIGKKAELLSKGLIRLVNFYKNKDDRIRITGRASTSALADNAYNPARLRRFIADIVDADISSENIWAALVSKIKSELNLQFNVSIGCKDSYLVWKEEKLQRQTYNIYEYNDLFNSQHLNMEVGTIHSVKGQTHLATLVLESYYRAHDIKNVLNKLCSDKENKGSELRDKTIYVALTRAKALVCLAIPETSVDDSQKSKLEKTGWIFETVRK